MTICTHNRAHLFGHIPDGKMQLSPAGEIAAAHWHAIPHHHPGIELDAFVVMPNHVHGIIIITHNPVGTGPALSVGPASSTVSDNAGVVPTQPLGTVVGSYKSGVTRRIRKQLGQPELIIWQSRYHDHIIRNIDAYHRIRTYVLTNPARWEKDTFYE